MAYRIGDEQNAAAPADTMGIYVFLNTAPIVSGTSSPCSCTTTVKGADGTLDFNSANQPYWFWSDVLGAAGSARDTTLTRKTWVFEADTQVTRFNFDVLVSAAWASPHETVWTVKYPGNSLPDTQADPRWTRVATSKVTVSEAAGLLNVQTSARRTAFSSCERIFDRVVSERIYRGTVSSRQRREQCIATGGDRARRQQQVDRPSRLRRNIVGAGTDRICHRVGKLHGGRRVAGRRRYAPHLYSSQFGTDSVVGYVDGAKKVKTTYAALPSSQYAAGQPSLFEFGIVSTSARNTVTTWDYVVYQIGKATP